MARTTARSVISGSWLVNPVHRGYNDRPHLYAVGMNRSVCGRSGKPKDGLLFDYPTSLTVPRDRRTTQAQFRRPCELCKPIHVAVHQGHIPEPSYPTPEFMSGDLSDVFGHLVDYEMAGFVITRLLGASEGGAARFEVDTSRATETGHLVGVVFAYTRSCTSVEFLNRSPSAEEVAPAGDRP